MIVVNVVDPAVVRGRRCVSVRLSSRSAVRYWRVMSALSNHVVPRCCADFCETDRPQQPPL